MNALIAPILLSVCLIQSWKQPTLAACDDPTKSLDTAVAGVPFCDQIASKKILGQSWSPIRPNDDWSYQLYTSADGKQQLKAFVHDGGTRFEYDEFEVRYTDQLHASQNTDLNKFVSCKGISLGLRKDSVISLLGECVFFKQLDKGFRMIYTVEAHQSASIRRYRQEAYVSEYDFVNDTLVRFRYGFTYP